MAALAYNKSELKNQNDRLKAFKKFVPSLELKRKQLIAQVNITQKIIDELRDEVARINDRLKLEYPMVAKSKVYIDGLINVKKVKTSYENIVGVKLPKFDGLDAKIKDYGDLTTPVWIDCLSHDMIKAASMGFRVRIEEIRLKLLKDALRKTTQRLNLFEKVMIPQTLENIKKIKIYLSDAERAFVVQAKIAKKKFQLSQKAKQMSKEVAA